MAAATNKRDLLIVTNKEFNKLVSLLDRIDTDVVLRKDQDDISIKDTVAHRAHWIDLFIGWYNDGQANKEVFFPAEGYKWSDLKRYNADLRSLQADLGWDVAQQTLNEAYERLRSFLQDRTENELYGGPMAGANNHWTPGRWAEAAGPSNFRSAAKFIRAALRD